MSIETKIKNTIVNEVFKLFTQGNFEEGKTLLHDIYLENYNDITNLGVKRLLIHNLAWAENRVGDISSAKMHIQMIKDEIENDIDYISNNMLDYCLILNLYCELFKDKISIDEYKEINIFIANYHHESGSMGREFMALTNVYKAVENWDGIVLLIKELVDNNANEYFINEILAELEANNMEAFNEAKKIVSSKV